MKLSLPMMAAIAALTFTGCATVQEPVETTPEAPAPTSVTFTSEGVSVADPSDALSVAKAEITAATIAKANLLEKLKGSVLSNNVKVSDLMFVSQEAELSVYGWLNNVTVEIVEEEPPAPTNLPVESPESVVVTATATVEVSMEDLEDLSDYVE